MENTAVFRLRIFSLLLALGVTLGSAAHGWSQLSSKGPDSIQQLARLTASNQTLLADVAISGNVVVAGAPSTANAVPGAAYVFVKPASGWADMTETAKLTPSDNSWSTFGSAVAISGDTIVVAEPPQTILETGSVYLFVKPASGWTDMRETAKLTPSDGGGILFGLVAVSGNTVAVVVPDFSLGNRPRAYVYAKPAGGWISMTETAQLSPRNRPSGDNFGSAVAVSGNTIVVGAPNTGLQPTQVGKAYVFVKPTGGWANMHQTAELTDMGGRFDDLFSYSAAISGDTIAVGAPQGPGFTGAAYVFVRPVSGWANMTQTAKLTPADKNKDLMGWGIALSGNNLVAGAVEYNQWTGAGFLFTKPTSGWANATQPANLFLSGVDFGSTLAISGNTMVAPGPDGEYVFGP